VKKHAQDLTGQDSYQVLLVSIYHIF